MIALFHLAVTWALVGLIWTIQLVHYPSFRYVEDFAAFHPHHTASITWVVGPLMLAEMGVAAYAALIADWRWEALLPFLVVILIWGLTFFWAVPLHEKLATQRDARVIEQLIVANWPRTILWTGKGIWLLWFFWRSGNTL